MILIADSGSTKTTWSLLGGQKEKTLHTQGISPYFMTGLQITGLLQKELLPKLKNTAIESIFFYGTGCSNAANIRMVQSAIHSAIPTATNIVVQHDLMAAARALCGKEKGIACILGTGSNSCVFNGEKITKNNPAPGFILGDEGSGAYLGKKVLQHFIYGIFDEELMHQFQLKYNTNYTQILHHVYKEPFPNRYMAAFTTFLSENRQHFMIENIIEDGLSDFFFNHVYKYKEAWVWPVHFVGSIAFHFRDVIKELCQSFGLQLGKIIKSPMEGLITFHKNNFEILR